MAARSSPLIDRLASLRARRVMFWCYAAGLFVATHWPKAEIPGPPNTDKVLHIIAFGAWTFLFAIAAYIRPIRRPACLLAIGAIAAVWAGVDELLQEIPFINRHATVNDYVANLIGVAAGLAAALVAAPAVERADARPTMGPPD